jgi:hypothetical protein
MARFAHSLHFKVILIGCTVFGALAAVSGLLGASLALALLQALARLAPALDCGDVAARARGAMGFVIVAGVALALGFTVGSRATDVLLIFAALALPMTIVALVQFLRVALAVSRVIGARSTEPPRLGAAGSSHAD